MPEWVKKTRKEMKHRLLSFPEAEYEYLTLADDVFRLEIHEDDKQPGLFYPYLVRMSGPLSQRGLTGIHKEIIKQDSLEYLRSKLTQAIAEIDEIFLGEKNER